MAVSAEINRYLNNHYEGMTPEQLILMLFKGALDRIRLAEEAIDANDLKKRGEHLSKTIAIISELHASVDTTMTDEGTIFLRGLYTAILFELPKVSMNNDKEILRKTHLYISRLKEIWETTVMAKGTKTAAAGKIAAMGKQNFSGSYGNQAKKPAFRSISV
jgi:flagellar secretion chaperone FliS